MADQHLARAELLAVELAHEVELVGADDGIGGEEADDERVVVDRRHGPVAQAEIGLRERRHPARRHLQHLERALAGGAVAASAAEVYRRAIVGAGDARDGVGEAQQELVAPSRASVVPRAR